MTLTILALVTAEPGKEAETRAILENLIPPTKAEEGCIDYSMHIDNEKPGFFMFYENWATRELWLKHMDAPHIVAHREESKGIIASVILHEMTRTA